MGKTIVVGDVHGCLIELEELLSKCSHRPGKDRLIFVGDLINRGDYSLEVLQLAYALGAECVLGNHEVALLNRFSKGGEDEILENIQAEAPFLIPWIRSWPFYIKEKKFIVVHAGIVPEYSLDETPPEIFTTVRCWDQKSGRMDKYLGIPWYRLYRGNRTIIYGHWAFKGLTVRENTIGLDSGCVWGGSLSALILPQKKIVQVKAKKCYVKTDQT